MITFYQIEGKATVVWDRDRDRALCEFEGRQLTTDDENVIAKLRELGYPEQGRPQNYKEAEQMAQIDQINENANVVDATPQELAEGSVEAPAAPVVARKSAAPKAAAPLSRAKASK